jgi:hypothetical protein
MSIIENYLKCVQNIQIFKTYIRIYLYTQLLNVSFKFYSGFDMNITNYIFLK